VPAIITALYGLIVSILVLGLSIYHTGLALKGQTTSEEQRDKYEIWGGNPYSFGDYSYKNWLYFWNTQESLVFSQRS